MSCQPKLDTSDHEWASVRAMFMPRPSVVIAAVLVLGTVTSARADDPPPPAAPAAAATPLNYVTVAATTTLFHKPNVGPASGWLEDIGPVVGYGRYVTDTVALELDVGPSFVHPSFVHGSGYSGLFLVPSMIWGFSTHVYAAARFLVELDPQADLALFPGIGGVYTFDRLSVTLELNLESFVGQGKPDFAIALTPGLVYAF